MSQILLIDDADAFRLVIARALEAAGHHVVAVSSGQKGLEAFDRTTPDMVLVDLVMPGMDGHEVIRRIRERTWGQNVPIIVLTGSTREDDLRMAIRSGAQAKLIKSHFSLRDLRQCIDRFLAGSQAAMA